MRHLPVVSAILFAGLSDVALAEEELPDVIERVKHSVVVVETKDRNGKTMGHGSGFAVAPGIIATNVHVLKGASRVVVTRSDGKWATGRGIWHFDTRNDVALVQLSNVEDAGEIPVLKMAAKDSVKVGTPIYVVGHPKDLRFTVTNGIISAIGRHSKEFDERLPGYEVVQTDAPTLPGSSGGPWVNALGEVVAVHRAGYTPDGVPVQGFNFGVHLEHLEKLLSHERKKMLPITHFSGNAVLAKTWQIIVPPDAKPKAKTFFTPLDELKFEGPSGKHEPGDVRLSGTWKFDGSALLPSPGSTAAVSFGDAESFTLDGQVDFGAEGGCFWLLGWKEDSGYLIREPGLRKSAHWLLVEIKEGKPVPGSEVTLSSTRVTGKQPIAIRIDEGRLSFQCGPAKTEKPVKLDHYHDGQVILGTYPSGYGPRPLRVLSARIRAD